MENSKNNFKSTLSPIIRGSAFTPAAGSFRRQEIKLDLGYMSDVLRKTSPFCLPFGKADAAHLLCCQGLAVADYGFALGRLEAGAASIFAQSG